MSETEIITPTESQGSPVDAISKLLQGDGKPDDDDTEGKPAAARATDKAAADKAAAAKAADKGDADKGGGDQGGDGDQDDDLELGIEIKEPPPAPGSLAEMAETLGVDVAELYKLAVPMEGGDTLTLGELKDRAKGEFDLEGHTNDLSDRRVEFENEMIRAKSELNEIVGLLPVVPPALIARAQEAQAQHIEKERISLLQVKPEWADDAVYAQAKDDILAAVTDYGFTRADMDAVLDHRLTKLLHDFSLLRKRVAAASAKGKEVRQSQQRQGRQVTEGQRKRARTAAKSKLAHSGTNADKTAAVADLLRQA